MQSKVHNKKEDRPQVMKREANQPVKEIKLSDLNNFPKSVDTARASFFVKEGVKECKDIVLRTRLQTLIKQKGLTNREFYKIIGISRQYYYFISWGIWACPLDLRLRIAKALDTDSSLIFNSTTESFHLREGLSQPSLPSSDNLEVKNG